MLVRHAMTRHPIALAPGDLCHEVLNMFRARCIRHAPVLEDGQLVGVVSDRDLLRGVHALIGALEEEVRRGLPPVTVAEVMSGEPLTCSPGDAIDVVARRMHELRIGCMPVVSEGVMIGLVTITDLLHGFTQHLDGEGVRRLNLLWSYGRAQAPPDLCRLVTKAAVELVALLTSETDTGARIHIVRVQADEAGLARFVDLCLAAGLLIVGERAAA